MAEADLNKTRMLAPPRTPNGEWILLGATVIDVYVSRAKRGEWDIVTIEGVSTSGTKTLTLNVPALDASAATPTYAATTINILKSMVDTSGVYVLLDRVRLGPGQSIKASGATTALRVTADAYPMATWLNE